jgi:hypothetical protein
MANTPLELDKKCGRDGLAKAIGMYWSTWNMQRNPKIQEWKELRNYLFATDTSTTSNNSLPWKNKTTLPKLCQIRDNLHSNYISALFPNDEWLSWEGYSVNDSIQEKRKAIEAYMSNKCRMGDFRQVMSQLLLDYIDYGNAFATCDFISNLREGVNGEIIPVFIGPKARRISPMDIVFNPLATSFEESPKIVRSLVTIGEIAALADSNPDNTYLTDALKRRKKIQARPGAYGFEDAAKYEGIQIDGFGSYMEYLTSGYVEVLNFYGDIYDEDSGEFLKGYRVVVIDRMWVIEKGPIPQWLGGAPIYHCGWRTRPDNLWAMGPLDNLVGMQYRIDHLENLKADAMDLAVMPPLVIAGEVEAFTWEPGAEIHLDENGTVTELARNAQWVIQADNAIQLLEQRMEMYSGAPREAMGIRTAGEKTAFEVQQLQNAAGRIFQEKITHFETMLMEKLLNAMLETSVRNLDRVDVVRAIDNDLGAQVFLDITKDDITANGVLRPIGARHFAAQAQMMQNLTGVFNSPVGQMIAPHVSTKKLATLVEDMIGIGRFQIIKPFVQIEEQQELQTYANTAQETMIEQDNLPTP